MDTPSMCPFDDSDYPLLKNGLSSIEQELKKIISMKVKKEIKKRVVK